MQLESLLSSDKIPDGSIRELLVRVRHSLEHAVDQGRRFVMNLRPETLEAEGLDGAIAALVADQPTDGPKFNYKSNLPPSRFEPRWEDMVYRIVEEAITNVRRHSHSERAEIFVAKKGDRLHVVVQDWGVGFDPAQVGKKCLGWKGIQQRVQSLRGRVQLESEPGKGSRIAIDLPLARSSAGTFVTNDRSFS